MNAQSPKQERLLDEYLSEAEIAAQLNKDVTAMAQAAYRPSLRDERQYPNLPQREGAPLARGRRRPQGWGETADNHVRARHITTRPARAIRRAVGFIAEDWCCPTPAF
jgi:hypothetical protein